MPALSTAAAVTFTATAAARTFGVEIELVGIAADAAAFVLNRAGIPCIDGVNDFSVDTHGVCDTWKVVSDGSVWDNNGDGVEVVSPVLSGDAGMATVYRAVAALQAVGAYANSQCGLHVHHGAKDFTVNAAKSLIKRYVKGQWIINQIAERGNVNYSEALTARVSYCFMNCTAENLFAKLDAAQNIRDIVKAFRGDCRCHAETGERCECDARYAHINFGSFWKQGTVEFRQHAGTVDPAEVCAWIALTQSFMVQALNATPALFNTADYSKSLFFRHLKLAHYSGAVDGGAVAYCADKVLTAREIAAERRADEAERARTAARLRAELAAEDRAWGIA